MPKDFTYSNFDLRIHTSATGYKAEVQASPTGEGSANITLPQLLSKDPETAGSELFSAVFIEQVRSRFLSSLDRVRGTGNGILVRLILEDTPVITSLPWETLYNSELNEPIGLSRDTPVVRCLQVQRPEQQTRIGLPIRILVASANPSDDGYDTLDIDREWKYIKSAFRAKHLKQKVKFLRIRHTTRERLREAPLDEVHFVHVQGHGEFNDKTGMGELVLENEYQESAPISARDFAQIVGGHRSIHLVILNACKSAKQKSDSALWGVAQTLVRHGIPYVIAMNEKILDESAILFAQKFYKIIADGYPIEYALIEARNTLKDQKRNDWMIPILFSRLTRKLKYSNKLLKATALKNLTEIQDLNLRLRGNSANGWSGRKEDWKADLFRLCKESGAIIEASDHFGPDERERVNLSIFTNAIALLQRITNDIPLADKTKDLEIVISIRNLIEEARDSVAKYQLAVCYFYWGTFLLPARLEVIHDARRIFRQMGKFIWVSNCDKVLKANLQG